jgi:hypothetical protein
MSTNCLVTKLKGSVQNDNLPILGKIIIEIPQMEQTSNNSYMVVASAPNASVNMELVNSTVIDGFPAGADTFTISPNVIISGHITVTNSGQRVILDAYNVRTIQQALATNIIGLESLNYGVPKRVHFENALDAVNMLKLKNIECLFSTVPSVSNEAIQTFVDNNRETLVYTEFRLTSAVINTLPKLSGTAISNTNIEDLPSRLNFLYFGANCTGSVNTLIDNWRNAGRTSGKIQTPWLSNSVDTTIDTGSGSVSTTQWCIDHNITAGRSVYLSWDANSLTITNDATGAAEYPKINNFVV